MLVQRIARRWLLRRSIRFSRCVQVLLSILITHITVTARFSGGWDLGLVASGRAIRSGDATGMDSATGTVSAEA